MRRAHTKRQSGACHTLRCGSKQLDVPMSARRHTFSLTRHRSVDACSSARSEPHIRRTHQHNIRTGGSSACSTLNPAIWSWTHRSAKTATSDIFLCSIATNASLWGCIMTAAPNQPPFFSIICMPCRMRKAALQFSIILRSLTASQMICPYCRAISATVHRSPVRNPKPCAKP